MNEASYFRQTNQRVFGSFLALSLVACSSAGRVAQPPPPPRFITYIDENGAKNFALMVDGGFKSGRRDHPPGGPPGGRGGPPPGGSGGPPPGGPGHGPPDGMEPPGEEREGVVPDEHMKFGLRRMLELRLAESGFCREGYTEVDSSFDPQGMRIMGRCNEAATDADRSKYPNTQP